MGEAAKTAASRSVAKNVDINAFGNVPKLAPSVVDEKKSISVNQRIMLCGEILRSEIQKRSFLRPRTSDSSCHTKKTHDTKEIVLNLVNNRKLSPDGDHKFSRSITKFLSSSTGNIFCTEDSCRKIEEIKRCNFHADKDEEEYHLPQSYELIDESYEIHVSAEIITVTGRSCRAILFGLGRLLRKCILGYIIII